MQLDKLFGHFLAAKKFTVADVSRLIALRWVFQRCDAMRTQYCTMAEQPGYSRGPNQQTEQATEIIAAIAGTVERTGRDVTRYPPESSPINYLTRPCRFPVRVVQIRRFKI